MSVGEGRSISAPGLAGAWSTGQLEALLRHLPTAALVVDAASGRVLLHNDMVTAIWRRPPTRREEEADHATWDAFHLDGRPYLPEEWPPNRTVHTGEAIVGEELEILRGDGTRGIVRISSNPVLGDAGEVVAAVATITDVTKQRSDDRTRHFLATVSAVLGSSLSYGTTLRNVAELAVPEVADWCAVDILGEAGRVDRLAVEHGEKVADDVAIALGHRSPRDIQAPGGVTRVLRTGVAELALAADAPGFESVAADEEQVGLLRALGATSVMIVPLLARGKIIGSLTFVSAADSQVYGEDDLEVGRELAARAALAIDNARLYHETQAASRAKSDFLAVMSHELRTPLNAIAGYTELLEIGIHGPLTDAQRDALQRVSRNQAHLLTLIDDVLRYAQLEAGKVEFALRAVPVDDALAELETFFEPQIRAAGLEFVRNTHTPQLAVVADADKLHQILLNLISNAIKFTPQGGRIMLGSRQEGDLVHVTVEDTGIGIDAEFLDAVFDPFFQGNRRTNRPASGVGLGLAISRDLARGMGGDLTVRSVASEGAAFTITLQGAPLDGARADAGEGRSGVDREAVTPRG
jgi:signal transduction histidine kinase